MSISNCLLRSFNQYSLTYTTQVLLSNLTLQELQHLLKAIENRQQFESLIQLVRGRIVISISEQSDRTIYFSHFESISLSQFKEQRSNQVSGSILKKELKNILESFDSLVKRGQTLFQQEFESVKQALLQPSLPLPPVRRQNIGPSCQTAYQIELAMQQLYQYPHCEQSCFSNQKTIDFFMDCLNFQVQLAFTCVSSIKDDLEHFAEITYRFMIYRNSVLALHSLYPFPQLTQTMKLWNNKMFKQYQKSHLVFLKLICNEKFEQSGLLGQSQIKQEGYMVDYIEGLIDQSVDERDVTFCGHSKQKFRGEYGRLQNMVLSQIAEKSKQMLIELKKEQINNLLQNWAQLGLKPTTMFQIIQIINAIEGKSACCYTQCCRQDFFIQNCARINGQNLSDLANIHLQCS